MSTRKAMPVGPASQRSSRALQRLSNSFLVSKSESLEASPSVSTPQLGSIMTPPNTSLSANIGREAVMSAPRRLAPPPLSQQHVDPPSDKNDEVIATPQTGNQSVNHRPGTVRPEDDPEVRRDFEARIAVATAALNRTPSSGQGSHLERKMSKRGPMIISTPKLMASSKNLPSTPLTPPEHAINPSMAGALDKTSGSTSKMASRWRKLAFRKGSSVSGDDVRSPAQTAGTASIELPAVSGELKAAIALRPVVSGAPGLDKFRFPSNPAIVSKPEGVIASSTAMNHPIGTKRPADIVTGGQINGIAMESVPVAKWPSIPRHSESVQGTYPKQAPAPFDLSALLPEGPHSPTSSDESAIATFVEAGKALGLNNEQLNEMLLQKGMLDRSATSTSSRSYQSTRPTSASLSQPSPPLGVIDVERVPSTDKSKRGLFRSFSRGKKQAATGNADDDDSSARKVVVRRTLLVPSEPVPAINQFGQSPLAASSPNMANRLGEGQRKLSIKRKPINLTPADHELVSSSPPAHKRNFSTGTAGSSRSDLGLEASSLGFLHPNAHLGRSTSSAHSDAPSDLGSTGGGSLYDLYGDDSSGGLEVLRSPSQEVERRSSVQTTGSTHAVEIW